MQVMAAMDTPAEGVVDTEASRAVAAAAVSGRRQHADSQFAPARQDSKMNVVTKLA